MTIMEDIISNMGMLANASEMTQCETMQFKTKCENETEGHLNDNDGINCTKCKNRGYLYVTEQINGSWYSNYMVCSCMKARNSVKNFKQSGMENLSKKYTFSNYETKHEWQKRIKQRAEEFTQDDKGSWFFIGGQSGSGKTHICTAITVQLMRYGKSAKYMLWRDQVTRLKGNVNDPESYEAQMLYLKHQDVLYIDDLFKTGSVSDGSMMKPTAADINIAFEVINYRYNQPDKITIISSELELAEIIDIDEAVGCRIRERAGSFGLNIFDDKSKNYRMGENT